MGDWEVVSLVIVLTEIHWCFKNSCADHLNDGIDTTLPVPGCQSKWLNKVKCYMNSILNKVKNNYFSPFKFELVVTMVSSATKEFWVKSIIFHFQKPPALHLSHFSWVWQQEHTPSSSTCFSFICWRNLTSLWLVCYDWVFRRLVYLRSG